jgi:hypothetical protein
MQKRLAKAQGVKLQAAKQVLTALKKGSLGCSSLRDTQVTEFYGQVSRDTGKLLEKLAKGDQSKALYFLSQVGMIQLLLCKALATRQQQNSDVIWVQPQLVGFLKGAQWADVEILLMQIRASDIPSIKKWGANGLKFGENVHRNTGIGIYCGLAVIREFVLEVIRK